MENRYIILRSAFWLFPAFHNHTLPSRIGKYLAFWFVDRREIKKEEIT